MVPLKNVFISVLFFSCKSTHLPFKSCLRKDRTMHKEEEYAKAYFP